MMKRILFGVGAAFLLYMLLMFGAARLHWTPFEPAAPDGQAGGMLPVAFAAAAAGAPAAPPAGAGAPPRIGAPSVAGALHVHTAHSHDAVGTRMEVAAAARASGLDFVVLSDHPSRTSPATDVTAAPRVEEGVLLVDGREINFGRDVGRVLVFGMDTVLTRWDGGVEAFAELLERRGGTAIAAHPRSPLAKEAWHHPGAPGIAGWEAFDLSDIARYRLGTPSAPYHLLSLLTALPTGRADVSLLRLHRNGFMYPGARAFDSLSVLQPLTAVAGANAHPKGRVWGRIVPGYAPFFRAFANHLLLRGPLPEDPAAAGDSIAAALAGGRAFISFGDTPRARAFVLEVEADGEPVARVGDVVRWRSGMRLRSGFPGIPEDRLKYRIVRNGRTVAWVRGRELHRAVSRPGTYRVEVYRYSLAVGPLTWNLRPWIFSNPVHLTDGPAPPHAAAAAP